MLFSTRALFTSLTTMVIVSAALKAGEPFSVTRMGMEFVLGPCASVGVQVKRPVVALIGAPGGAAASRLKLSVCAGMSGSVAAAVNEISVPSGAVRLVMAVRTGGLLDSSTMI